ncbi:uncharacterized protein B0I36DRAFT_319222 [Microdochium trichocladiopsis]|uniref:Uncharacterized protein n=1 Tax=Microdochium trichocladiopsis TaxID=1682393 RepID=A0A9P8YCA9_9PEZI|nr:uncharacterized protein B0I36DRAFT_319222 [Microdochium trichocladiopsis]KAH7035858.1 hypothetical protein B0I36DRAFT_319222 [Microdochium trichocladiopsis]
MYEWTTPADGHKEVFFRNMLSFAKDDVEPLLSEIAVLQREREQQRNKGNAAAAWIGSLWWFLGMLWVVARLLARLPKGMYSVAHMDTFFLLVDDRYGKGPQGRVGQHNRALKEGADEWDRPSRRSRAVTYMLFAVLKVIGRVGGWKVWKEEYTPERLRNVARSMH